MNDDTLITNENQLTTTFGLPTKDDFGLYAAARYLRRGTQLRYCRVGASAAKATVTVPEDTLGVPQDVMEIEAKYEGTFGDTIEVTLADGSGSGYYNVSISIVVDNRGNRSTPETFEDVVLDDPVNERYIETIINDGTDSEMPSEYITVDVLDGSLTPLTDTYTLTGGDDGISGLAPSDYIGTTFGQTSTGLQVFANPERVDLNLIGVPGVSDAQVVNEILDICSVKRMDCFGLIDSPFGLTPAGVVDWHNGTGYSHTAFNNSYGSVQWPWVEMTDSWNGGTIWAPPSGFMSEVIAYNDYIADPWYAAAGLVRGKINAIRTEYIPTKGERDYMYSGGNAINPIMAFPQDGIAVYGQRTLSRRNSALNRINVRRLMLYVEKSIATSVRYIDFDPHDETTWKAFTRIVEPFMDDIKRRRGVYDFRVICDETTNTDVRINRNEMYGKVLLKPTKAAEFIIVDFGILETGADFAEV
jgi:hypothetical protein